MKFNDRYNYSNQGLSRLIQDAFGGLEDLGNLFSPQSQPTSGPKADLHEDDQNYYVLLELPGVDKSEVKLNLADGRLDLSASVSRQTGDGRKNFELKRRIQLPDQVGDGEVTAKLEDGILIVTLPKAEVVKPRTIEVR